MTSQKSILFYGLGYSILIKSYFIAGHILARFEQCGK